MFENDQFSFNQQQLNKVIGETFPRCDYKSVNEIAGYLADNFLIRQLQITCRHMHIVIDDFGVFHSFIY